jgi:hypothetical protein
VNGHRHVSSQTTDERTRRMVAAGGIAAAKVKMVPGLVDIAPVTLNPRTPCVP